MRGLLIGRFQPFHQGHRFLIERVSDEVDELIIGIGSAEKSYTVRNPFTSGERIRMISTILPSIDILAYLVPIQDIDCNSIWVHHVTSICPHFDTVYTNNPLVKRLFQEQNFETRGTPLYNREKYQGKDIRRRMVMGEEWSKLVPDSVQTVITDIEGVQRLREISVYTGFPKNE